MIGYFPTEAQSGASVETADSTNTPNGEMDSKLSSNEVLGSTVRQ